MKYREIKFRCWQNKKRKMIYGVDIYYGGNAFEGTDENPYDFDRDTLGQYTGVTDKNGKEIYEADIFCFNNINFVVKYKAPSFIFESEEGSEFNSITYNYTDGQVIGNIYEKDMNNKTENMGYKIKIQVLWDDDVIGTIPVSILQDFNDIAEELNVKVETIRESNIEKQKDYARDNQ